MSNEKWRSLKLGDVIYPYNVENRDYSKKIVIGITSDMFEGKSLTPIGITVSFSDVHRMSKILPTDPDMFSSTSNKDKSFFIRFSDENSRRGNKYVGHLTEEEALEHKLEILESELKRKQLEVDKVKENLISKRK